MEYRIKHNLLSINVAAQGLPLLLTAMSIGTLGWGGDNPFLTKVLPGVYIYQFVTAVVVAVLGDVWRRVFLLALFCLCSSLAVPSYAILEYFGGVRHLAAILDGLAVLVSLVYLLLCVREILALDPKDKPKGGLEDILDADDI